MRFLRQVFTFIIVFITISTLIYFVSQETGIATIITFIIIYVYALIGIPGNTLYSHKLHEITKNLNEAIRLIQKRLK